MLIKKISDKFEGGGACIDSKYNLQNISSLNYKKIVSVFEEFGIILFRNYFPNPKKLKLFSDKYTELYSTDATRRKKRFNDEKIRNVDLGSESVSLHSEASFSPAWPEIIWFYCIKPSLKKSGETTLCDGVNLWQSLSYEAKNFFLYNPINYKLKIEIKTKLNLKNSKKRKWILENIGTGNTYLNLKRGELELSLNRFAVNEGRNYNKLCFANHLLIDDEKQIIKKSMINGKKIPKNFIKEIYLKSNNLTYAHTWKKGDLLMIDNKRFMHGRKSFGKGEVRDIVNIQTLKANFAYGSSIRKSNK